MKFITCLLPRFGVLTLLALLVSACGSSDKIVGDILDDIETKHSANISYVNGIDESVTFYIKSTVYPNSVFDNDHRIVNLQHTHASNEIKHKWIDGAKETEFAIADTNTASKKRIITRDLQDNQDYWSVAWMMDGDYQISLFNKLSSNQSGKFRVRVFTDATLPILLNGQAGLVENTEPGQVTDVFSVENCSDLRVGATDVDLCQSADFGQSYLVVVNNLTGSVVVAQE